MELSLLIIQFLSSVMMAELQITSYEDIFKINFVLNQVYKRF